MPAPVQSLRKAALLCAATATVAAWPARASETFESPPVHPVDMTPDGTKLLVAHTADARLVVFDLAAGGTPAIAAEIQVGLEPVTVRARSNSEAWVVNHISDSISIVDLETGGVVRTLLTGDEPTDVAFTADPPRAFVCVSQEDRLRVFDLADLDAPAQEIPLDASDPRSLALSRDGRAVYVCALDSGNETTIVPWWYVEAGGGPPPPMPRPGGDMPAPPRAGLIVRHDGAHWLDEIDRSWDAFLPYRLYDNDVIEIDAASLAITRSFRGVGTSLFNLAVNPATGMVYCSNIEARNEVRFEPNLQGRFARNRVTLIDPVSGAVSPQDLNPHIDGAVGTGTPEERARSLAFPLDLAVSSDGARVYLAAFGSHKVAVLDAEGQLQRRIEVGQGPGGLALDEARGRLYVANRFASSLSVVDLASDASVEISLGFDPTPPNIKEGRRFLYDGEETSGRGDLACGTCHLFGSMDNIAWDLGNPLGTYIPPDGPGFSGFHPMKGPMVTQSLKGLPGTEPFHWRGDRASLFAFNPAFVSLMGRPEPLNADEFQLFEDFVFSLRYPPNPFRNLDGSLPDPPAGPNAVRGEDLFLHGRLAAGDVSCGDCHALPAGTNGFLVHHADLLQDQDMKIPQLRNVYEKTRFDNTAAYTVRGFGYTHEGSFDDLQSFLSNPRFEFPDEGAKQDVIAFLLAFSTDTHAAVGAQWTMDGTNEAAGLERLDTLIFLAFLDEIGLVAKECDASGDARGWMYLQGDWIADRLSDPPLSTDELLARAGPGTEITFTGVIEGTEMRLGIDRDGDGIYDRDEIDAGTNPGDPRSYPGSASVAEAAGREPLRLEGPWPNPASGSSRLRLSLPANAGEASLAVYDAAGRRVRRLLDARGPFQGTEPIVWDLRDEAGRPAAAGVYFVRLFLRGRTLTRSLVVAR